ncbi:MAG: hypothetical protein AB1921_12680 [Thermodesulfobacteriota bacterium]
MDPEKPPKTEGQPSGVDAGQTQGPDGAALSKLGVPDAEEIARLSARWMRARELEEKRKVRTELWRKRLWAIREAIARPYRAVESTLEDVGRAVMAPFHGIIEAVRKYREERERIRHEKWLANLPAREEAARKKWEKKRIRQEAREQRKEAFRARFAGVGQALSSPIQKYRRLEEMLRDLIMAPFRAISAWSERAALARQERKQIALEKTRESREETIQKRHAKLLAREQRKKMRRLWWRRRLSGVSNAWQWFRRLWRNTRPIRQLVYLLAIIVLAVIYRHEIIAKVSSFTGFDLQKLMK